MRAALDQDIVVGADALLLGCGGGYVQGAAGELDVLLAPDAVSGGTAGGDLDGRAGHHAHIVVGDDAGLLLLVVGIDGERAAAAEDKLSFGEDDALHIFVIFSRIGRGGTVGKAVRAFHHDEGALAALVVEGGTGRIRERQAAQEEGLFLGAVQLEETVRSGAGEFVHDVFGTGVVHGDLVPVYSDVTIVIARHRGASGGKCDGDHAGKCGIGDVVIGRRITGTGVGIGSGALVGSACDGQGIGIRSCFIVVISVKSGGDDGGSGGDGRHGAVGSHGGNRRVGGGVADGEARVGRVHGQRREGGAFFQDRLAGGCRPGEGHVVLDHFQGVVSAAGGIGVIGFGRGDDGGRAGAHKGDGAVGRYGRDRFVGRGIADSQAVGIAQRGQVILVREQGRRVAAGRPRQAGALEVAFHRKGVGSGSGLVGIGGRSGRGDGGFALGNQRNGAVGSDGGDFLVAGGIGNGLVPGVVQCRERIVLVQRRGAGFGGP